MRKRVFDVLFLRGGVCNGYGVWASPSVAECSIDLCEKSVGRVWKWWWAREKGALILRKRWVGLSERYGGLTEWGGGSGSAVVVNGC